MNTAIATPYSRPVRPPIASPPSNRIPLNSPSKRAVLTPFIQLPIQFSHTKERGTGPSPRPRPDRSLAYLHLDLARFGDFLLRQSDGQNAVLVVCLHRFHV